MSVNLENMSYPDLIQLQSELATVIKETEKKEKISIRKQMEALAEQSGFTLDEVVSGTKAVKKNKVKPKYVNPNNAEQTWTGRGRRPKWVEAEIASGTDIDDLLI